MSRTSCLVLRPTLAEFNDIETLMRRAEIESEGAGIVKIVPPVGWWDGAAEASQAFNGNNIPGKTSGGRRAKNLLDTLKLRPIRQAVSRPPVPCHQPPACTQAPCPAWRGCASSAGRAFGGTAGSCSRSGRVQRDPEEK